MKVTDNDALMEAAKLLRKTVLNGRRGAGERTSAEIGELFLAELQARRQRLQQWLRIIHAEAGVGGAAVRACGPARRCRTRRGWGTAIRA